MEVDYSFKINVFGVYVIGDVIFGFMFVYKVEEDGVVCVEFFVGKVGYVNYDIVFGVVYIYFEVVSVGKIEE